MPKLIDLQATKSYATRENAIKAVEKKVTNPELANLRYIIYTLPDGRFVPVFIGTEALQHGIHFHFHVLG